MIQHAFRDMFVLAVPVAEKIVRPILVYLFLVVALRLSGKREMAQLNMFDLVVLLTLSNSVQNAIIGEDNTVTGGIIGACALLVANYGVIRARYFMRGRLFSKVLEGTEAVLIENGKVQEHVLRKEWIRLTELEMAARRQGFDTLDEIDRALIEPGGIFVFERKRPHVEDDRHVAIMERLE